MTQEEAQKLKDTMNQGYHNRKDCPPFARTAWDDRNRYREYIFKIIDEFITPNDKNDPPRQKIS